MSRSADITVTELRSQLNKLFPGRSAIIASYGREELINILETGALPSEPKPKPVNVIPTVPFIPSGDKAAQLAAMLQSIVADSSPIDENAVREIVQNHVDNMLAAGLFTTKHEIVFPELGFKPSSGLRHENTDLLSIIVGAKVPVMLVGPTGSGKTHSCNMLAENMGLKFYTESCNEQMSTAALLGFKTGLGDTVRTSFRECFELGGLFLLDEIDRGRPGVLSTLNSAIGNGFVTFPDGLINMHKDFYIVAGANSFGRGGDRQYTSAVQLDGATLDRFFCMRWDYDYNLIGGIAGLPFNEIVKSPRKSGYTAQSWFDKVTSVMNSIQANDVRHTVSPRAVKYALPLLDYIPKDILEFGLLWRGINDTVRKQIGG